MTNELVMGEIEELEFVIFQEIKLTQEIKRKSAPKISVGDDLWGTKFSVLLVVKELDGCVLVKNDGNYYSTYGVLQGIYPKGEMLLFDNHNNKLIGAIDKDALEQIRAIENDYAGLWDSISNYYDHPKMDIERGTVKAEDLQARYEEIKKQFEFKEEEETEPEPETKDLWKDEGIATHNFNKNVCKDGSIEITLTDKWWNSICPVEASLPYSWQGALDRMQRTNFEGEFSFKTPKHNIIVHVENRKCKIGEHKVLKARLYKMLEMLANGSVALEDVKVYNRLSGIKMDLVRKDFIETAYYGRSPQIKIPISARFVNDKQLKIKLFGIEKEMSWNDAKDLFVDGLSVLCWVRNHQIIEFGKVWGLSKAEVLQKVKAYQMANNI